MHVIDFTLDRYGNIIDFQPPELEKKYKKTFQNLVNGYSIYLGDETYGTMEINKDKIEIYYTVVVEGIEQNHSTILSLKDFKY